MTMLIMSFPFYDRVDESEWLKESLQQVINDCSRMLVITGRRRIGKTALVNHVFDKGSIPYIFLYVNKEMSPQGNLRAFWEDNAESLGLKNLDLGAKSFAALFKFLFERSETQPMVLVIDEFQNLETLEPSFFGELQKYWDRRRKKTRMLLVLTGSVATAMREITENINAPLYGRKDGQLMLQPFSTTTVKQILSDFNADYRPDDLLTLHMIAGGVAEFNTSSGEYQLNQASNTTAIKLAEMFSSTLSFNQAGTIGATQTTLANYASTFVGSIASQTSNTKSNMEYQQELCSSIATKEATISGVDIDQELSYMIMFQQSYAANAKAFTANKEILDMLMGII